VRGFRARIRPFYRRSIATSPRVFYSSSSLKPVLYLIQPFQFGPARLLFHEYLAQDQPGPRSGSSPPPSVWGSVEKRASLFSNVANLYEVSPFLSTLPFSSFWISRMFDRRAPPIQFEPPFTILAWEESFCNTICSISSPEFHIPPHPFPPVTPPSSGNCQTLSSNSPRSEVFGDPFSLFFARDPPFSALPPSMRFPPMPLTSADQPRLGFYFCSCLFR